MNEILILVNWYRCENGSRPNLYILDENELTNETIYLSFESVGKFNLFEYFDAETILDDRIINKIKKLIFEKKLSLQEVLLLGKVPEEGEFIIVFTLKTYKSNHYEDPTEYDMDLESIGILGEDVKLEY